jgi:hypothetical protein
VAKRLPQSVDSDASFNAAAKHLFRHLHEARALRKNPLVRRFFENPEIGGLPGSRDRAVLARIHELVRRAADEFRDADLAAGDDERALRHHAIVTLGLLQRRSMQEVAASLGLSEGYCYRERAAICRRIAAYFHEPEQEDVPALEYLPSLNEFSVIADRTRQFATLGDAGDAFRACDELVRFASSPEQRVEALRISALTALGFGESRRALEAHALARRIAGEDRELPSPVRETIRASLDLIAYKLALHFSDSDLALRNAQSAVAQLEAIRQTAPGTRELYVEALYELGVARATSGDVEGAYDNIAAAEANLGHVRLSSSRVRSRIMILLWRLRTHLLTNCRMWYPSQQRVQGLMSAFEQAYAAGLYIEAASALVALGEARAYAGRDDEALRVSRLALLLANQHPNKRMRAQFAIMVAALLGPTRHWRYGFSLLPESNRLDACDTDHRELFSYLCASRALRDHAFKDAWNLADATGERSEYAALTVSRRLIGAAAAHKLERRRDAYALVEAALPAAEKIGAPLMKGAFSVAARVTGEARYERRADEISRLLTV